MTFDSKQREIIKRCQESSIWWMRNFVRIKHPGAGIIKFDPFSYQKRAIKAFRQHRFNIFKKTRQVGASKVAGIFALWYGMFSPNKTILIVSRTDADAINFLAENVKIPFKNLPEWMQNAWLPRGSKDNEHSLELSNGTKIRSLTSHPDVLRSNAASFNIIDESAFIQDMDSMWTAGWPTLTHGGSACVISTTSGVGGWYWNTWTDAEAKLNDFNPIFIPWWEMTWRIEYNDSLSGEHVVIAPTDGITETVKGKLVKHHKYGQVELDPVRYGKYWSPWLEEQWRALQAKGEGWKFDQEILAEFVGSGNTILSKQVLVHVGTTVNDQYNIITGPQVYVHPVTGIEEIIDFTPTTAEEGLWIWQEPQLATPDKFVGGRLLEPGRSAHSYVMGVDTATGKGKDYQSIEIYDVDIMDQAAELMFHCLPSVFIKMVDRIGRWYNNALAVVERNNGGDSMIDDLHSIYSYPRIWRRVTVNDKPTAGNKSKSHSLSYSHYGHFTSDATKAVLNKFLIDYIRDISGAGFTIRSRRLHKQLHTYVRKKDKAGRDTNKTGAESGAGNHDDLVMATALAMLGVQDSATNNSTNSVPIAGRQLIVDSNHYSRLLELEKKFAGMPGSEISILTNPKQATIDDSIAGELAMFSKQLVPLPDAIKKLPIITHRKHTF